MRLCKTVVYSTNMNVQTTKLTNIFSSMKKLKYDSDSLIRVSSVIFVSGK